MSVYSIARFLYRWTDHLLLRHLPGNAKVRACLWHVARALFPTRIKARSAIEFSPAHGAASRSRLPAWAEAEVTEIARYEPLLAALVGPDARVEHYHIPWDMNYVGRRYAEARRQLRGTYACLVLSGAGASAVDMAMLGAAPRPLAIIDVVGDKNLAALAHAANVQYVTCPAEHLDSNDHCALLARLVLQVAPAQVLPTPHATVARCIERHGKAMASVSALLPLPLRAGAAPTSTAVRS